MSRANQRGSTIGGGDAEEVDNSEDTASLRMLNLAVFDEKIHLFLGVQSDVASLRHTQDLGFIRINAQPMKQSIRCDFIVEGLHARLDSVDNL